jgi:hypothetical protein
MLNRTNKLTHPAPPKPIQYPDQASVYSAISYSLFLQVLPRTSLNFPFGRPNFFDNNASTTAWALNFSANAVTAIFSSLCCCQHFRPVIDYCWRRRSLELPPGHPLAIGSIRQRFFYRWALLSE